MQAAHRNTDVATVPRQYRNRPNCQTLDAARPEPLSDAVYLVGEDTSLPEQISTCLGSAGTTVMSFVSGKEYLGFQSKDAAACVIINTDLPDMSGLDLQCRMASASNPSVIFISNGSDVPTTVCAMKAGAIDCLKRPFDLSTLLAAIQIGLAHDRKVRQRKAELAKLQARFQLLTPREREVLPLVIGGLLNKQAAAILGISEVTLQIHRSQVMRKTQANSVAELVRMAIKLRISHWREQPSLSNEVRNAS